MKKAQKRQKKSVYDSDQDIDLKSQKLESKVQELSQKMRMITDSDADGLSDYQEKLYGTNPNNQDSDADGLSDYEEIKVYQTNPNKSDTDGDGVSDGKEVKAGRNPRGGGHLKDLFFAYSGNQFSPGLLKTKRLAVYGLSALAIKLVIIIFVISLPLSAWVTPDISNKQAEKIINLTNEIRKNLNIEPLIKNDVLSKAAYLKAQDMLVEQYFAHISPKKKGLGYWLRKNEYTYSVAGENLAMGFSDAADVVNAWVQSKTHYENIIDPDFKEVGVGVVSGKYNEYETTLVAQFFGTPDNQVIESAIAREPEKNNINENTTSTQKVFGEKIVSQNFQAPILSYPSDGYLTGENPLTFKVIALSAEKLLVYLNEENILEVDNQNNGSFEFPLSLKEGDNNLRFESILGSKKITSQSYKISLDQTPPEINLESSKLSVLEANDKDQKIVRAEVFLGTDTKTATVNFGNYKIELQPDQNLPNKWTGSTIIFNQENEQLFNPVVLPSITLVDQVGNSITTDIYWDNIKPVKASLMDQYFFARNNQSGQAKLVFSISSVIYKIMLGLITITLLINIFTQIRKQQPKVILSSLVVVGLLAILIII